MADVECPVCGEVFGNKNHLGSRACRVIADTKRLFALGLAPYPRGNSLPEWLPVLRVETNGCYGLENLGQPAGYRDGGTWRSAAASVVWQYWAPVWVRVVTESFNAEPGSRRDVLILRGIDDPEFAAALVASWRLGGLDSARVFLRDPPAF
jgi:hypothetical protein